MYKLAQLEDKRTTLDNVAWYVHWQLCGKTELEWEDQWYNYRIYSINRPGRLLNFCTLRVGAYSRWALIRGWALIKFSTLQQVQYVYFATKQ